MSEREAWCVDKMTKLLNEDLRISTLNEIRAHFSSVSQDEANETAKIFQLPLVFDCLNDSKTEQIDLACEILSMCMSSLSIGESTNKYGISLERALYHPSSSVKLMALKEILRTASNNECVSELSKQHPLIVALVTCVGDSDLSVARKALDILVLLGKTKGGLKQLLSSQIKDVIAQTIAISDTVRFRIYEIVVSISCHSEENLQALLSSGLILSLISELDSSDILLKLNVIELLSNLAASDHGLNFLENEGIIQTILNNLPLVNEDPMAVLVLPGFLKFFGNVAHLRPSQMYSKHPVAFKVLFDVIESGDFSTLGVAYDTLGYIAITAEGKFALQNNDQHMPAVMKLIGTNLSSLPTELSIRAMNCVENVIRVLPDEQNNRVCSLAQQWFSAIHSDPINSVIMKYAQNPFKEIRCAALGILQALAELLWGQQLIYQSPGLIEFLLDRRIETTKESKEVKYIIVKTLATNGNGIFPENIESRLQQFMREGPFYVQAETEVAIEGNS